MSPNQVLDKVTESGKNFFLTILSLLGCMLVFGFMAFSLPGIATEASHNSAVQSISAQQKRLTTLEARASKQMQWFSSSYTNGFSAMEANAKQQLNKATEALTTATTQSSAGAKVAVYGQAESYAQGSSGAKTSLDQLEQLLDSNDNSTSQAVTQLNDVKSSLGPVEESFGPVNRRFEQEKGSYLKKYTDPLKETLSSALSDIESARTAVTTAEEYLPINTDVTATGDPTAAMNTLKTVSTLMISANSHLDSVSTGLDYQKLTKDQAEPLTQQAYSDVANASRHLTSLVKSGGFTLEKSLATANTSCESALTAYQNADQALSTLIEGKYDYPFAYDQAKAASNAAATCITETDRQVTLRQTASDKLGQVDIRQTQANGKISDALSSYETLVYYHSEGSWLDVSGNIDTANQKISDAKTAISSAKRALRSENYTGADTFAQDALTDFTNAEALANAVINKATSLEGYRSQWPQAESNAESEIDANSSDVANYGSYDYGAASNYDQAVSLLSQARNSADSANYATAVTQANRAQSTVEGTGSRAYNSYLIEKKRIADEEQRQRDEAQRQRDADAAAAAAALVQSSRSSSSYDNSYSSSSNSDYDSGSSYTDYSDSSSCCSSDDSSGWDSSSSDDGGGWDSSSSGDDGGGWGD